MTGNKWRTIQCYINSTSDHWIEWMTSIKIQTTSFFCCSSNSIIWNIRKQKTQSKAWQIFAPAVYLEKILFQHVDNFFGIFFLHNLNSNFFRLLLFGGVDILPFDCVWHFLNRLVGNGKLENMHKKTTTTKKKHYKMNLPAYVILYWNVLCSNVDKYETKFRFDSIEFCLFVVWLCV